ncbi:hypothetical protein [Sulfitobacter brevis]|uniref:hypothetical protein n=1 Tax=Sulfitobacter brevis TaxID=74348 RepID=UPI000B8088D3|nr:hypothetical protein [Sulfitobacter brevis]
MSLISSVLRLIDATHPENFSGEEAEEDAKIEREKQLKEMRASQLARPLRTSRQFQKPPG